MPRAPTRPEGLRTRPGAEEGFEGEVLLRGSLLGPYSQFSSFILIGVLLEQKCNIVSNKGPGIGLRSLILFSGFRLFLVWSTCFRQAVKVRGFRAFLKHLSFLRSAESTLWKGFRVLGLRFLSSPLSVFFARAWGLGCFVPNLVRLPNMCNHTLHHSAEVPSLANSYNPNFSIYSGLQTTSWDKKYKFKLPRDLH